MSELASRLGFHHSTVSLALRDHPSIPFETRERIRLEANRCGYTRDPGLDAFITATSGKRTGRHGVGLVIISESSERLGRGVERGMSAMIQAARNAAMLWGQTVDHIDTRVIRVGWLRALEIARARGLDNILHVRPTTVEADTGCTALCRNIVCIAPPPLGCHGEYFWHDKERSLSMVVRRGLALGHAKMALLTHAGDCLEEFGPLAELRPEGPAMAIHEAEVHRADLHRDSCNDQLQQLASWMAMNRITLAISATAEVSQQLEAPASRSVLSCDHMTLEADPDTAGVMGIRPDFEAVGRMAMNWLLTKTSLPLVQARHHRGVTLVPGTWAPRTTGSA